MSWCKRRSSPENMTPVEIRPADARTCRFLGMESKPNTSVLPQLTLPWSRDQCEVSRARAFATKSNPRNTGIPPSEIGEPEQSKFTPKRFFFQVRNRVAKKESVTLNCRATKQVMADGNVAAWGAVVELRHEAAEKRFRKLDAPELLPAVYAGQIFADGKTVTRESQRVAA